MSAELPKRYFELHPYRYDAETGEFTNMKTGRTVGKRIRGYGGLDFEGKTVYTHRLAWRMVHGEWPSSCVDHINGDRSDNRLANLRLADYAENAWNRKDKQEQKGWSLHPRTRIYTVQVRHRGVRQVVGYFRSEEEAQAAYRAAKMKLRGEVWNA